jgi:hypothetical protein
MHPPLFFVTASSSPLQSPSSLLHSKYFLSKDDYNFINNQYLPLSHRMIQDYEAPPLHGSPHLLLLQIYKAVQCHKL